jgi:mannose-6-phosphate isomerase-like protein (cupin superfamily)
MTDMTDLTATTVDDGATPARHASRTATGEGPAYRFFDALAVLRTPEGACPVVIEMTVPPGGHAPLHVHRDLDDSFYLLSGRIAMRCGDETFVASPGDYVSLPHGVPHTFFVLGEQPAVMIQVHGDGSFLDFIRQVGAPATNAAAPATQGPPDFDAMYRVAAATGQPVIGPPMSADEAAAVSAAAGRSR